MNEEKLLEKIRNSARNDEPSAKLEPDFIKDRLEKNRKTDRWGAVHRVGCAAAAVCLVVMGAAVLSKIGMKRDTSVERAFDTSANETTMETAIFDDGEAVEGNDISEGAVNLEKVLVQAESYEQILTRLAECYAYSCDVAEAEEGEAFLESEPTERTAGSIEDGGAAEEEAAYSGYSATNIQELGVEEGDIVKTDGTYIYILKNDSSVQILEANGDTISVTGCISNVKKNGETVEDMYVTGDRLILISAFSDVRIRDVAEDVTGVKGFSGVKAYTYDISDRGKPDCLGVVEQEGAYSGSRLVDGYLYLYSNCYKSSVREAVSEIEEEEADSYFPSAGGTVLKADEIYIPQNLRGTDYMIFASVDLENPNKIKDKKAVMSMSDLYYVSTKNIYLTQEDWSHGQSKTTIIKMDFSDGVITPVAAGVVPGYLNDNFSMSEYDGYLRVVTTGMTNGRSGNHLYILDENMNITGRIENLAADETIKSARFLGNTGYFVTYREMDPLFSADLSDPYNPKILGERKITGFSSYLHFYGENLLFGLGYETDPDTGEGLGIKLSMYDISDPENVKEVHKLVLELDASAALSNYKSLLIDPEKNLIGFVGSDYNYGEGFRYESGYYLFQYDPEQGFVNLLTESLGCDYTDSARGIYISDTFYLVKVNEGSLTAYDMTRNFAETGEITY